VGNISTKSLWLSQGTRNGLKQENNIVQKIVRSKGELSPGIRHSRSEICGTVGRWAREKGGLSEYARVIGKTQQYVSQFSQAAKVTTQVVGIEFVDLLDKTKHLAAIHKAPEQYWQH
jgi:hypothetical protein